MPIELEAKFRVDSHEPVRKRLRAMGAEPLGAVIETNVILDSADGSLRRRGSGLRVRSATPCEGGASKATLTYKGPTTASAFKSREEIETEIGDADASVRILVALGFVPVLRYEKRRESWRYGGCRIELDVPPHIGLFIEIEGPTEDAIRLVRDALGLSDATHVRESYVRMLTAYGVEHGIADDMLMLDTRSKSD